MNRDSLLIGGQWVRTSELLEVENPATEEVIAVVGRASVGHVADAVHAARAAARPWEETGPTGRADLVATLADRLRDRRAALIDATVAEVGAPVTVAAEAHVDLAIDIVASAANIGRALATEERFGSWVLLRRPVGVAACITPWNYPLYQLAAKVAPALVAGCPVVVKPAELTPISAYLLADAVREAGFPPGTFNLLPGLGTDVGQALVEHPDVNLVSFTGSTRVGRQIAATAGARLARVCLELGGKSASVVCHDADLETAVRATVDSAMLNSGQTCSALTRLIVPLQEYAEAVDIAADQARRIVVGDPRESATQMGPLISAAQREQVRAVVEGAVRRGARLVTGGTVPDGPDRGYFYAPTVLADLDPKDPASQEEIFGPVLVVHASRDDEDAIAIANGTRYGLAGAVWSGDEERAMRIARRMDTGQVDINGAEFNIDAPFGGWKDSGVGRELGRAGIEEYLEVTAVQR
ncbi:aldehyde dehydrogenase family protein [uncultured Aeromicrobium sp.]|uniref:aldehyde dehydrogenase family protein n=1 Tax=uncultured Aeromicrobium sp. TaxID=337820 RepID=UPI0025FE80B6|nr:aldehyde dehydrogenase family protein [uncultured Aeromicrobium sp.]